MLTGRVAAFIEHHRLFGTDSRVGVGVSGGADSVCLLYLLFEVRSCWNLHLEVIHINHQLRGAHSDADEEHVRALAATLGLPFHTRRVKLPQSGANLEESAREARRAVFRELRDAIPLDRIALAHTLSDQAETVLFRFLRGSYTTGLAGMRPATPDGIVRPMLEIERDEIEGWLRERAIEWREDHTNRDPAFARNRIRHSLLPALRAEWNPNLATHLARHATLAQEDEAYWENEVGRLVPHFVGGAGGTAIVNAGESFEGLPPALARRLIRKVIEQVKGDLRQIDFRHIDSIYQLMCGDSGHFRLQAPGLDVLRSFDQIRFARPSAMPAERNFSYPISPPGEVELPGTASTLCLEIIDRAGKERLAQTRHDTLGAELDWNRLQSDMFVLGNSQVELLVRNWRPGDAYRRSGDRQERKLKTLFHTARIPLWERRHWPVLSAGGRIIWTRGFGPAHEFAAGRAAEWILKISERPGAQNPESAASGSGKPRLVESPGALSTSV